MSLRKPGVLSGFALLLLTPLVASAQTPTNATVSVDATTTSGVLKTQLSTNNVWSGMIDQAPGAQARLNALQAPLLRIHAGDDGWPAAMPELQQNSWDFSALDALVNNVRQSGQYPLMNIKFAPDWMWTCTTLYTPGEIQDKTFQTFADYMVRIVSYYNLGRMTTESGQTIVNPAGTSNRITWWELWNEPDLNNETPCVTASGNGLTPSEYVTMWNAVTAKMLLVDPTLKFVGPATAGSQFGSATTTGNQYVDELMSGGAVTPSALSIHGYGYWDNTVTDQTIFDGDSTGSGGIQDILSGVTHIRSQYPTIPVYLTEVNVNADWGNDPAQRPSTAFGAAWWATLFAELGPQGVDLIHQFDVIDSPQFGLLSDQTVNPYLSYWEFMALNQAFPKGSTLLSSTSSQPGIIALAARRPDGKLSILVVDRQVQPNTTGGSGIGSNVRVNLQGVTPTSMTLQMIDATTDVVNGPTTQSIPATTSPQITFGGYGFAVLTISPLVM